MVVLSLLALPAMGCLDSERSKVINSKDFEKAMLQYKPKGNNRLERKIDQVDRALFVADSFFQIQDSLNLPVIIYGETTTFIPSRNLPQNVQDEILRGLFEQRFGKDTYNSAKKRLSDSIYVNIRKSP